MAGLGGGKSATAFDGGLLVPFGAPAFVSADGAECGFGFGNVTATGFGVAPAASFADALGLPASGLDRGNLTSTDLESELTTEFGDCALLPA